MMYCVLLFVIRDRFVKKKRKRRKKKKKREREREKRRRICA